jgi:hypothetical protein
MALLLLLNKNVVTLGMDPWTIAKDDKDLENPRKRSFADELVAYVGRKPASVADVYILVGRNAQSQSAVYTFHWQDIMRTTQFLTMIHVIIVTCSRCIHRISVQAFADRT